MILIKQLKTGELYDKCEFYCDSLALYEIHGMDVDNGDGGSIDYIQACHAHLCVLSTTIEEFVNALDI